MDLASSAGEQRILAHMTLRKEPEECILRLNNQRRGIGLRACHDVPRDTLIMRVANKLFHRVLSAECDVPRTALAGWFRWEKGNENFLGACLKRLEFHRRSKRTSKRSRPPPLRGGINPRLPSR